MALLIKQDFKKKIKTTGIIMFKLFPKRGCKSIYCNGDLMEHFLKKEEVLSDERKFGFSLRKRASYYNII